MNKFIDKCRRSLKKTFSGYFTQLLLSLILLFVFRPYDRGHIYMFVWQFLLVAVFLSAIFNCNHSKNIKIISACFGIPALLAQWTCLLYPSKILTLFFIACMIIFIFITTASIVKQVVINARVRMDTLRGVVCAYFMVAFGFSFLYLFIGIINPEIFHFVRFEVPPLSHSHYLSELMYFSFVTLLCIGYGDILAVKDVGQTIAILEGIIGQFYIAMLVSRLVAVYSFYEHKLHLTPQKKTR